MFIIVLYAFTLGVWEWGRYSNTPNNTTDKTTKIMLYTTVERGLKYISERECGLYISSLGFVLLLRELFIH